MNRWQYSVRALFGLMALLAVLISLFTRHPSIAITCLIVSILFICIRTALYILFFSPFYTRLLMIIVGTTWLLGTGYLWIAAAIHDGVKDEITWPALGVIVAYSAFFYWGAWVLPQKFSNDSTRAAGRDG